MAIPTPRGQRGITLIEIILVCAIVAAAAVGIFVFANKARVTAAVETEQRQVQDIVKTVEGLFATQPNFAALGTNGSDGAEYLKAHAARAGLSMTQDSAGNPALRTGLGGGHGTLTIASTHVAYTADPGKPDNGFVLTYEGLTAPECISLVTSTASFTTKTHVAPVGATSSPGSRMSLRGVLDADKGKLATACSDQSGKMPSVRLYFAPARAITSATPPAPPAAARCTPIHERQDVACPSGQVGTITQERDGSCTGPGNSMVYTAWSTTDNTCQDAAVAPPTSTPPPPPDNCVPEIKTTRVQACPAGQIGQRVEQKIEYNCAGTSTPWTQISDSCQTPPASTCTPSTETRPQPCPAGLFSMDPTQPGIIQRRNSYCESPTSAPKWVVDLTYTDINGWELQPISNICAAVTSSCVADGTCCVVKRDTRTTTDPCPVNTYGNTTQQQEQFLGCVNATTQAASWTPWQTITGAGSCTACPPPAIQDDHQWVPRQETCPAGWDGKITYEAEQVSTSTVSYSCPAGTTSLPAPTTSTPTPWTDTGAKRKVVNSCDPAIDTQPACGNPIYSPNITGGTDADLPSQVFTGITGMGDPATIDCDAAHVGQYLWAGTSGPSGTWGSYVFKCQSTGDFTPPLVEDHAPWPWWNNKPNNPEPYQTIAYNVSIDWTWGQGAKGVDKTWAAEWSCYVPPATCTGPASETQWLGISAACPTGQTGTHTWEYEQTHSRTCNAGTWSAWSGWANTGAKRNEVNTCATAPSCHWETSRYETLNEDGPAYRIIDWKMNGKGGHNEWNTRNGPYGFDALGSWGDVYPPPAYPAGVNCYSGDFYEETDHPWGGVNQGTTINGRQCSCN